MGMMAAAVAAPRGGIFIPRNGSYEGRVGQAHVLFDVRDGGVLRMVAGEWPNLATLARFSLVFAAQAEGDADAVEVRQDFDRNPELNFLEEGNDRIGLRVKFKLFDQDSRYFGHGMTETWLYPNGEVFVTAAATFENAKLQPKVLEGYLEGDMPNYLPPAQITQAPVALNDASLPDRSLIFRLKEGDKTLPGTDTLSLYWRTGRMEHNTFTSRGSNGETGAPTYYRWPDYFRQAYGIGTYAGSVFFSDGALQLRWPVQNQHSFNALFRLAAVPEAQAKALVAAEKEPVKLAVQGGVIHGAKGASGYNDQEGAYEVRKIDDPLTVTLPADPLGRTVRIKAIALGKGGAVTAALDGKALVPQLSSDGGIADDPLAPIREMPENAADAAMVTVKLGNAPQQLVIREAPGVQYTYMTRDPWRNFACFTSNGGPRWSGFRFSLIDGHARNMRAYGNPEWALGENLLTWFSYCGYTPEQVISELRDFEILKNGPDEAIFRYVSANSSDAVESEYIVRVPADSPAMRMDVTATFTVLDQWPYESNQFFDVFPFRGVWTQDWWFPNVLWVAPDGRWKTMNTVKATFDGDTKLQDINGGGFFSLFGSDRGNMVMLVKNPRPDFPIEYVICGNYIDYHMTMKYLDDNGKPMKPGKGFKSSVQYELAVWGDETVTRDRLIEIGKASIEAGTLALPK